MVKANLTMFCKSTGNFEKGIDDNGLQHAVQLASGQESASRDFIRRNDADDCQLSHNHCDTTSTGRDNEESTEVENGEGKFKNAMPLDDGGETILYGEPSDTVGETRAKEIECLIREDQFHPSRKKNQKYNFGLPVYHVIPKEEEEDVDGGTEIGSREVGTSEAKFRSGRSAKDGGCLKNTTDLDIGIQSSLTQFWAKSCQSSASLAVGLLLLILSDGVGGALTAVPVNTLVGVGKTARINCATDMNQPVFWARTLAGSDVEQWLYYGLDDFNGNNADVRFSIDKNEATGRYDVMIEDVQHKDAGQYVCIDDSGLGARASADLVISDTINCKSHVPTDGVMGDNVFNIKQDIIEISCSLTYTGNLSPNLEWSWPGSDVQNDERDVFAVKSFVASTLKLSPSKEHNEVKFQCKANIEGGTQYTVDSALQWESEAVNVKYAAFAQEEVDSCPGVEWNLICNPQCSYSFEERKDHECRCLYAYNDTRTQQPHTVFSPAVSCGNDNASLSAVLITIAVVTCALVAIIAGVYFLKRKKIIGHSDLEESRKASGSGEPMLEAP